MKKEGLIIGVLIVLVMCPFILLGQSPAINLIPKPNQVTINKGTFNLNANTQIFADASLKNEVVQFCESLLPSTGINFKEKNSNEAKNSINLSIDKQLFVNQIEGSYKLLVDENRILIKAASPSGIYYGLQTLLQLLPEKVFSRTKITNVNWSIPCVEISDSPRFEWRGFMLDASRHFQSVEYVKRTLDLMAMHKMNVFHWHLTDDQGWRIEIKKYPWLTEKGAWRNQPNYPEKGKTDSYGGYYTQEQIREVVTYAKERHITIIPEVDLPGHSSALIYAMPELMCDNVEHAGYSWYFMDYPQREKIYIRHPGTNVVCAGKESVYPVIDNILSEIIELFPSEFIHIGGDEVSKEWWNKCPHCKKRMKDENLEDMDELQAYFIKRLEKMIIAKGRKLIGWDEILEGGLSETASVMSWRGMAGGIEAIKQGRKVVMASNEGYYIQKAQTNNPLHPQKWPSMITSKTIYEYDPIPDDFTADQKNNVLGIQTSLWTPFSHNADVWDIAIYPRNCALSEAAWSTENNKNWDDYQVRMKSHLKRLAYQGVSYWREESKIIGSWDTKDVWDKEAVLKIDATDYINESGVYFVIVNQENGEGTLSIEETILLKNGKQIVSDKHSGTTSKDKNHEQIYFLDLQKASNGDAYEIQIKVKGMLGKVSGGNIHLFKP